MPGQQATALLKTSLLASNLPKEAPHPMFKVIWDKPNNGARLCEAALEEDILAVAPRPVFHEELNLLALNKPPHNWRYPCTAAPLLWACDRRYFYGSSLFSVESGVGWVGQVGCVKVEHGH
jgi:hypothetical protein